VPLHHALAETWMSTITAQDNISGTALGTFDIFQALSREERNTIAVTLRLRRFDAGGYIISTTQPSTDVFFIVSGQVRVCAFTLNGRQVHFEDLHAGQMFGELAAIDGKERSGDCLAAKPSVLVLMTRAQFSKIIDDYPAVRKAVLVRLTTMLRTYRISLWANRASHFHRDATDPY